jgi:hypothetical protein
MISPHFEFGTGRLLVVEVSSSSLGHGTTTYLPYFNVVMKIPLTKW